MNKKNPIKEIQKPDILVLECKGVKITLSDQLFIPLLSLLEGRRRVTNNIFGTIY